MHKKAQDSFDDAVAGILGETVSLALAVILLLAVGWGAGVILAHL